METDHTNKDLEQWYSSGFKRSLSMFFYEEDELDNENNN